MPVLNSFQITTQGNAGNLCWAAAGLGISSYYDQLAAITPRWSRLCEYAMAVFSSHDGSPPDTLRCCDDRRILGPECNQPFWLPDALGVTGNQGNVIDDHLSYGDVKAQIDLRRPIGVEIQSTVGGHVVVIYGYDEANGQKVVVADPSPDANASALLLYDELLTDYKHSGGQWSQTYLTVPTNG